MVEVDLHGVENGHNVRGVPGMVLRYFIVLERMQKLPIIIERFIIGFVPVPPQMVSANRHLIAILCLLERIAVYRTFVGVDW